MKSKYTKKAKKNTIQKQLNVLKRTLAPERKYVGTVMNGTQFSYAGLVHELSACGEGTNDDQRVGNKLRCASISVKGEIRMNPSIQSTTVRVVIFSDNNSGGGFGMGDYLENVGTAVAPYQPYNRDTIRRFKTHYSRLITLNNISYNVFQK